MVILAASWLSPPRPPGRRPKSPLYPIDDVASSSLLSRNMDGARFLDRIAGTRHVSAPVSNGRSCPRDSLQSAVPIFSSYHPRRWRDSLSGIAGCQIRESLSARIPVIASRYVDLFAEDRENRDKGNGSLNNPKRDGRLLSCSDSHSSPVFKVHEKRVLALRLSLVQDCRESTQT